MLAAADLLMCTSLPNGAGVGSMKDAGLKSWRAAKTWHCERPGVAIGKDATSVVVGAADQGGVMERGLRQDQSPQRE